MPRQHRRRYAAAIPVGLPADGFTSASELTGPDHRARSRTALRPTSARFEPVHRLRGFTPPVPRVHLSASLAGPGPSGSARPSRRCQDCFPPSPASPGSDCPQLPRSAATDRGQGPSIPARICGASWRTKPSMYSNSSRSASLPRSVRTAGPASGCAGRSGLVARDGVAGRDRRPGAGALAEHRAGTVPGARGQRTAAERPSTSSQMSSRTRAKGSPKNNP